MKIKWWILFLVIIIISTFLIKTIIDRKPKSYSDDPKTWIDDSKGGVKEISVDKVTAGESYIR